MSGRTGEEMHAELARFFDIDVVSVVEAKYTCKQCGVVGSFSPCGLDAELREFQSWINTHFHRAEDGN